MSRRISLDGLKTPRGDNKRTWRRWKNAGSSRERNPIRFIKRVKAFAKKFGLTTEQADEFSYSG